MSVGEIINIEGRTFIRCRKCGFGCGFEPRTEESIQHIHDVEGVEEEHGRVEYINSETGGRWSFLRAITCISCGNVTFCRDRYSRLSLRRPGDPDFGLESGRR